MYLCYGVLMIWGLAPYRDRRNFMVKLEHHISGTGQRDYARLTVGQEFVELLEYGCTNYEWGLPRTVIAEISWLSLNIISLVRGNGITPAFGEITFGR